MVTRILFSLGTLCLVSLSNPASAQHAAIGGTEFSDAATDKVFHDYLHLRDALVKSDAKKVAKAASSLVDGFNSEQTDLKTLAQQIAKETDLVQQRTLFASITTELEELLARNITDGTVYKMYCPMANDGEGADWLSDVAEVRNPFLGEKMLSCGRVTEEITKQ